MANDETKKPLLYGVCESPRVSDGWLRYYIIGGVLYRSSSAAYEKCAELGKQAFDGFDYGVKALILHLDSHAKSDVEEVYAVAKTHDRTGPKNFYEIVEAGLFVTSERAKEVRLDWEDKTPFGLELYEVKAFKVV